MDEEKKLSGLLELKPVRVMEKADILAAIPHRPPFLFVDRVEIIEERVSAVGVKFVSPDEPFFAGHFPGQPIMPGVLILEAMAQTCAALAMSQPDFAGRSAVFIGIDRAKFRSPVLPGQTLKFAVRLNKLARAGRASGEAFADGKPAAEAAMTFVCADKKL